MNVLLEAGEAVSGPRQEAYGNPRYNLDRIAGMWSIILGIDVTVQQVVQCMVALKLARLVNDPNHRDSWVDIAGYARVWELAAGGGSDE